MLAKVCLRVPPTNLTSRKSKDDFTLSLLKKWRNSSKTSSQDALTKLNNRLIMWNDLITFCDSRPEEKFSLGEISKKKIVHMAAFLLPVLLISDALVDPTEDNFAEAKRKTSFSGYFHRPSLF